MKNKTSLPGIWRIDFTYAYELEADIMMKHDCGIPVQISREDFYPVVFTGEPTCEAVSSYNKNGRIEQVTLKFETPVSLPEKRHLCFLVTDCNGQAWLIGTKEKPRPIIKVTRTMGAPSGDSATQEIEITMFAQNALIPVSLVTPSSS